jgi:hypothetical protein
MPGRDRDVEGGRAAGPGRGRRWLRPVLGLGLLLIASAGLAFPFWLDSPSRSNRFDPRSPGYKRPAPKATATFTPSPVDSPSPTPTLSPTFTASPSATPTSTVTPTYTPSVTPGGKGAAVAYDEYEAEAGVTNGTILGPSRAIGNLAAEASGRMAVRLTAGQSVSIQSLHDANSIVVRYCIPDAPAGGGITATVSVYVGGAFLQKLNLTSRYSWLYGLNWNYPYDKNPADGGAFHFYDEARSLTAPIPAGSTVAIQVDPGDDAAYYVIDLIDLEQVAPPLAEPPGFLSITDFGAAGVLGQDDGPAIQTCITTAAATGQGVWIPQGTFYSTSTPLTVTGVTIRGAGMWYSTVSGFYARFNLVANNCQFYDFSILGDTINRDDSSPENGFNDRAGTGSRLENIWIEHTKCGYWENGGSGWNPQAADGLVITGCRVRDTMADGFNLNGGTVNSTVQDCALRYTGDDSLASWSNGGAVAPNVNDQFLNNTVQLPWRANCIAIYGGQDTLVRDNVCSDTLDYPGLFLAAQFNSTPFAGTTTVQANTVLRAGGTMWGTNYGALCLAPTQANLSGVVLQDLSITASSFYGLQFQGPSTVTNTLVSNLDIQASAAFGIQALPASKGGATFNGVLVSGSGGLAPGAPVAFTFVRGTGNAGW